MHLVGVNGKIHALRVITDTVSASLMPCWQGASRCRPAAGAVLADSQQHDLQGEGAPVGVAPAEPRRSMRKPVTSTLINPEEYQPHAPKITRSCASSSCCSCCAGRFACGPVLVHDFTGRCAAWVPQPKSTGGSQTSEEHVPHVDLRDLEAGF